MVMGRGDAHQPGSGSEPRRAAVLRAAAAAVLLCGDLVGAGAAAADTLSVLRADGVRVQFTVEHAIDPTARRRGLMHRPALPSGHGMLFDFGAESRLQMWMKDTLIPLDMIFIDGRGRIVDIAAGIPRSTAIVEAGAAARYVLEVNGGESGRLGIAPGDRVGLPALRSSAARIPGPR